LPKLIFLALAAPPGAPDASDQGFDLPIVSCCDHYTAPVAGDAVFDQQRAERQGEAYPPAPPTAHQQPPACPWRATIVVGLDDLIECRLDRRHLTH
jgi:hypothetical protein